MSAIDPSVGPDPAMQPGNRAAKVRASSSWIWIAAALGSLVLLAWVEPRGQIFYPRCALHAATGLQCPGCGGLRATHALLNGNLAAAWRLNPLLVAYLPVAAWLGVVLAARRIGRRVPNPFASPWMIGALVGVAFVFGVLRNLPVFRGD